MARLNLQLLGGFRARLEPGGGLRLPTRKAEALLAYLALPLGQRHPRDKLASLLWGDLPAAHARASLRQAIFRVRRAIGDPDGACLVLDADGVALEPSTVLVDVTNFEQAVTAAAPESLAQAAALYQGDLLAGLAVAEPPFEEWLLAERERLRELVLEGLARLLTHQRDAGRPEAALHTAVQLAAIDPLHEAVHRTLMRLYLQLGRRGAALRQYQHCVGVLRRELGVEPEPETKQLYQQVLRTRPSTDASTRPGSPAWAPDTRIRSRLPAADTPLIGRANEMRLLSDRLADARAGRGSAVIIEGEAGIGKSRLLTELVAEAARAGAHVLLGRCYESGQILPFGPWVEALRSGGMLREDGPLRSVEPVWRVELARLFPEVANPIGPVRRTDAHRLFESIMRLLEAAASATPLVLLLEDVHWADDMSLRLLAFVGRHLAAQAILVGLTAREEELTEVPALRRTLDELQEEKQLTRLRLSPLAQADTLTLMQALVRPGRATQDLERLGAHVWAMSQGNPFVVVEAVLAVAGRDTPDALSLIVPERVRGAIARRLEHLGALARELAAVGAVIGRAFTFTLLRQAAGASELEAAEAVEELVRRQVFQHMGDHFDFVHERVREVVYGELLPPRRVLLHRRVAEAIEALHAESPETQSLAVGLHSLRGEAWEKAVTYLGQAGSEAIARSAYREAAESLEQAISALERLPEEASRLARSIDLRLDLARPALYQLGDVKRAAAVLREAEARASALGDDRRLGRVTAQLVFCLRVMGHKSDAIRAGEGALDIARRLADLEIEIPANTGLGQVLYDQGNYRDAAALFRRNIDVLVGGLSLRSFRGGAPRSIHSRTCLVSSLAEIGEFDEAMGCAAEALHAAQALEHPHSLVVASAGTGHVLLRRGDWRGAIDVVEPALAIARAPDAALWFPRIASTLGAAYILGGRPGDAYVLLEEALARTITREIVHQRALITVSLGHAALALGRVEDARKMAEQALRLSRDNEERGHEAWSLCLLGEIASAASADHDGAARLYGEARTLGAALHMKPVVAHSLLGEGILRGARARSGQAQAPLTAAIAMFREMGMTFWVAKAEAALAPRN